ncbi:hypothetical protein GO013_05065 [Pseudodesulfovibrio sp. JC047]|nr:hypothetical protein [Pseudodesulfovibrio sp. JC047]
MYGFEGTRTRDLAEKAGVDQVAIPLAGIGVVWE